MIKDIAQITSYRDAIGAPCIRALQYIGDIQCLRRPNQVHTALHSQIERHCPLFIMLTSMTYHNIIV